MEKWRTSHGKSWKNHGIWFWETAVNPVVYNLRGGFLGSVAPAPEQKDFRTQSTSIYQFSPPSFSGKNIMSFTLKMRLILYKDMELSSEILIWVFWDYTKMFWPQKNLFQGGATNSKTRALLEHWSATTDYITIKQSWFYCCRHARVIALEEELRMKFEEIREQEKTIISKDKEIQEHQDFIEMEKMYKEDSFMAKQVLFT